MHLSIKQLLRFAVVGILNFIIDFGLFFILFNITGIVDGPGLICINILSLSAAITNSYLLNRRWTFKCAGTNNYLQIRRFLLATGFAVSINNIVVLGSLKCLNIFSIAPVVVVKGSKILGSIIAGTSNFFLYRNWVFKSKV